MVSLDTRSDRWAIRLVMWELSGLGKTYVQLKCERNMEVMSRKTISRWSGLEITVARILFLVAINTHLPRDLR